MTIEREVVLYKGPGGLFEGLAVADSAWIAPKPGILVMPNVLGPKEADFQTAERLAKLGFAAMVGDVFGQGNRATRADDDPARFMNALDADRALFKERLLVTLDTMKGLPAVDPQRVAAVGYCFGGKAVLDLVRCGAELAGGVSFHGVYEPPPFANVGQFRSKLLLCHGWDDPLAVPDALVDLAAELTAGGADWQIHAYGHAGHGFTDKTANRPKEGFAYHPDANRRSWRAMQNFLEELFG